MLTIIFWSFEEARACECLPTQNRHDNGHLSAACVTGLILWEVRMQSRTQSLSTAALAFGAIIAPTVAWGAEPIPIAGQLTCKIVEEHKSKVESDPAHELILLKTSCDGHASGQSAKFDGGQQTMVEVDDLIKGNGTIRGYDFIRYKDGSTQADIYIGEQITTVTNGKQEWIAIGTWEQTRGTGSLANAQFRGTWKAKSTSENRICDRLGGCAGRGRPKVNRIGGDRSLSKCCGP